MLTRLKSLLLLFAFLIGAIQPIVPLIEYHVFKDNIIAQFCVNRDVPDSTCNGVCYLANQIEQAQEKQSDTFDGLGSYYPISIAAESVSLPPTSASLQDYPTLPLSHLAWNFKQVDVPPPISA
jgi:hypothetical protein